MRTINVTFDDDDFDQLQSKMKESGAKNWREFILSSAGLSKKRKGKKKGE
jgi:hypothetical protein